MTDAASKIYTREGVRGLYKGTLPSILLTTPEAAFRFGIYQFLNNVWEEKLLKSGYITNEAHQKQMASMAQSALNGGIAGVCAKTIVYPFDLVKKRLQVQGFEKARVQFGKVNYSKELNDSFLYLN